MATEEQRQVMSKYQGLREEVDELHGKLAQIDGNRNEHELVLKQLMGLESDRRCWHQIGSVLAEKKVGEIVGILSVNRDQFADLVKQISDSIDRKEEEIARLQQKYGVREQAK